MLSHPFSIAILSGGFDLLGILVNHRLTTHKVNRDKNHRCSIITGKYYDAVKQDDCLAAIELHLAPKRGGSITRTLRAFFSEYTSHPATRQEFNIPGDFHPDRYLILTYRNADLASVQVGVFFLQYSEEG